MLNSIEVIAKTKEEALNKALNELNATIEQVNVVVLEEGTRGFLGIGSKPFKLQVSKVSDPVENAKAFLREVFASIGLSVEIECELTEERKLIINLKGDDMGVIIGKRGQTLDSLQYLTSIIVNKTEDSYVNVVMDTEQYRNKRKETLESLAIGLAKKAKKTRKDVKLEPMNPNERRIIHSTLQNDKYVTTHSEGEGAFRFVVISPKEAYRDNGNNNRNHGYRSGFKDGGFKTSFSKGPRGSYKGSYNKDYKKYKEEKQQELNNEN